MATRVALPPGVYTIRDNANYLTDPPADQEKLMLTAANNSSSQHWLVSGDGTIRSLDHGTRFAFAKIIPGSKRPVDITRSSSSTNWIIVAAFQNNTLSARIRTNDGMRQFWTANGPEVQLTATGTNWIFTEVIGA